MKCCLKENFHLIQILGLLGVYFDAEVVEVKTFYFYSDWLWPYCDEEARGICIFNWMDRNLKC